MRWKQTNLYNLKMMILMISTCLPTRASSYDLCPPRTLQAAKKIFWNNWQKFLFVSSTFSSFFPHLLVFKRVWVGVRPKLRSKRHHPLLTYRTENIKISKVCHKIVHVPLLCVDLAIIANFYDFFYQCFEWDTVMIILTFERIWWVSKDLRFLISTSGNHTVWKVFATQTVVWFHENFGMG